MFPKLINDLRNDTPSNVFVVKGPELLGVPAGQGKGIGKLFAAKGVLGKDIIFTDAPDDQVVLSSLWKREIAGIVTTSGHEYSHVAILARSLKIPMIIGFKGVVDGLIGKEVVIDEATGGLYEITEQLNDVLIPAPQVDPRNYLRIDPKKAEEEALKEMVGMSIGDLGELHNYYIEMSIEAAKKGDLSRAARLTIKANTIHNEIRRLEKRDNPFVVYAIEKKMTDQEIDKYSNGGVSSLRTAILERAASIDPVFGLLAKYYGDKLRIDVRYNRQCGQYLGLILFYRIVAVVEGGSPFLMREEIETSDAPLHKIVNKTLEKTENARKRARELMERIPGSQYVEYDIIEKYHDRGLINGKKVIGVLPPGLPPLPAKQPTP